MAKRKNAAPLIRMSSKEKMIVSYICERLEMAYRNTAGKAVYARNMDQVMKDIFGVKKFTKTLQRARYNETLMIQLMKKLDTETLWQITRSNEHYKLLCTLVALDSQIVEKAKKLNKYQNLDGPERPTRKMRKLEKEIKRSKKMYKQVVKTFRDIFDIQKVDTDHPSAILDTLSDWLDRHEVDDDIFYGLDDYGTYGFDAIESMDAYVRNMSKKPRANQRVQVGALGLDRDSSFDDDEYDDDDILDDDDGNITLTRDELQRIVAMAGKGQLHLAEEDDGDEDDGDEIGGSGIERLIATINRGFTKMSESIDGLYDMLDGDEDDEDEGFDIPADPRNARTIEQMQRISESARPVPGPVIEATEPETPATQNVTEGN